MSKLVFADVETVGTDPTRHSLWELALIVREDGKPDAEHWWQTRPDLTTADPMALKIGGYYGRCQVASASVGTTIVLDPGLTLADELDEISAWRAAADIALLLDGATLAAANVAFDRDFVAAFLRANGQALACDYHLLEMESYAAGAFGLEPKWRLDQLLELAGVTVAPEDRHSALGDARAIRDLYDAVRALRNGGAA